MTNRLNFTKRGLLTLPIAGEGKRSYYYDSKARGLCLAVYPNGTKSFLVYRKVRGKPERIPIGRFPDLTVEQARGRAQEVNSQIADGENPNDTRRAGRAEFTLGKLFEEYIKRHAKQHKKSWKRDQDQFDYYLSSWANRKISTIERRDIAALHTRIGNDHGHYAANRLIALLHNLFAKAIIWELWERTNPAHGIKRFVERSRERFLQSDELPRFLESLAKEEDSTARDFFLLALTTGARRSNVQAMRWEQINLTRAVWEIPDTKNGLPQTIPLSPQALQVINSRERESEWVFPANSASGHLKEPSRAWRRIVKRAGLTNLRIHDLRRTLASWMAISGTSLAIIGKSLGHKTTQSTQVYARLSLDPVRLSVETATDAMFAAKDRKGGAQDGD